MKKLFILLILPVLAAAQLQFIPISADYASFASGDSSSFVQVYLSMYQGHLKYKYSTDSVLAASFTTTIEISQDDSVLQSLSHQYRNTISDTNSFKVYNQFVDIFNLELPQGGYKAKVHLKDNLSNMQGEYVFDLNTVSPQKELYFSDIELCSKIEKDNSESIFSKNGLKVVPNPTGIYDVLNPLFYYYIELNNLAYSNDQDKTYLFSYTITNAAGDTIRKKLPTHKKIASDRMVEIGGMNVIAFPRGAYLFTATAENPQNGVKNIIQKKFTVYKPEKKGTLRKGDKLPEIANYYIGMTKEQLQEEFSKARYIATLQEINVFKNIENNVEAMQKFLTRFWVRKDRENQLPFGAYRRTYMRRVEEANKKYGSMGGIGWKSDQGRVFIIYGEPNEYDRHPSSVDKIPYVIWIYHNLEGGAQFIFAEQGFGQYRLIHSTYRKELQNPNWEQIISKNTSNSPY